MPLSGYTQHGGGGTQFGSVWRCEGYLPTGDFDAEARRRRGRGGGAAGESKPESAEPAEIIFLLRDAAHAGVGGWGSGAVRSGHGSVEFMVLRLTVSVIYCPCDTILPLQGDGAAFSTPAEPPIRRHWSGGKKEASDAGRRREVGRHGGSSRKPAGDSGR